MNDIFCRYISCRNTQSVFLYPPYNVTVIHIAQSTQYSNGTRCPFCNTILLFLKNYSTRTSWYVYIESDVINCSHIDQAIATHQNKTYYTLTILQHYHLHWESHNISTIWHPWGNMQHHPLRKNGNQIKRHSRHCKVEIQTDVPISSNYTTVIPSNNDVYTYWSMCTIYWL